MCQGRLSSVVPAVLPFYLVLVWTVCIGVGRAAGDEPKQTDQAADDESNDTEAPKRPVVPLSLLPVPTITLAQPKRATEAEAKEIRKLIGALEQIKEPDLGLGYPFFLGAAGFAPVSPEGYNPYDLDILGLKPNASFKKLVEYGPKAIPFLLEGLDDGSPSKLTLGETESRLSNDLPQNPVNTSEAAAAEQVKAQRKNERDGSGYTVSIGDICFVVLGQIANRCYSAFATERPAVLVVTSPVENEALAKSIRDIWGNSNHAEKLFQSLLIDFHTRGFDREDFAIVGPNDSVEFQKGAAMRLAFYFPEEASQLIADRLKGLDVTSDVTSEDSVQRCTANGINAVEFVSAVSWSSDPRIAAEVLRIFEKTTDEDMFLACCPGIDKQHDDAVFQRLVEFLELQFVGLEEVGHPGCLVQMGERFPNRAKDFFTKYLEINSTERRRSLCYTLMETCGELSIDLLSPLLSDKTKTEDGHQSGENAVFVNFRICDLAAESISMNCPELSFNPTETYKDMDRQIEAMKRIIAVMKQGKK